MSVFRRVLLTFALAVSAVGASHALSPAAENNVDTQSVDEWVVVLTDPRSPRRTGWSTGVAYTGSYDYAVDPKLRRLAKDIADKYPIVIIDQWPVRALSVHCLVVRIDGDEDETLSDLRLDDRVEWVQPLNTFEALSAEYQHAAGRRSGDPYRHLQASLERLNVAPLRAEFSGAGVRVAMIDSGVEADHPDLEHALAERLDFVGTGRVSERHGTGIAGVLIAASGNGKGIVGVAPGASLYAYRACWEAQDGATRCNSLTLSRALDHVVATRAHVVNLSLTGPKDPLLDRLVERIVHQGALVVVAYDPQSRAHNRFPSPRRGVITVRNGSGISESGYDALCAPGDAVLTAQPGHSYDYMHGASLAAAHVSGVLALMLEAEPDLAPEETLTMLSRSMRVVDNGYSVDACEAVRHLHKSVSCSPL